MCVNSTEASTTSTYRVFTSPRRLRHDPSPTLRQQLRRRRRVVRLRVSNTPQPLHPGRSSPAGTSGSGYVLPPPQPHMSIDSEGYFVRIVQFPHRITIVTSVFMSDCSEARHTSYLPRRALPHALLHVPRRRRPVVAALRRRQSEKVPASPTAMQSPERRGGAQAPRAKSPPRLQKAQRWQDSEKTPQPNKHLPRRHALQQLVLRRGQHLLRSALDSLGARQAVLLRRREGSTIPAPIGARAAPISSSQGAGRNHTSLSREDSDNSNDAIRS